MSDFWALLQLTELGCNSRVTSTGKAIESHSLERLLVRSRAEQACVPHTEVFTVYGQPYDNWEERRKTATVNSALTEQKQQSTDGSRGLSRLISPRQWCSFPPLYLEAYFWDVLHFLEILKWRSKVWEKVNCSLGSLGNLTYLVPTQEQADPAAARSHSPSA